MGSDIGQFDEWNNNEQLQWNLLDYEKHRQLNHYISTVNNFYKDVPAMHENDYDWEGFRWIALDDAPASIIAFRRVALDGSQVIVVCNFQPVTRENYKIGVPIYGIYEEVLNSESEEFGGCGIVNSGDIYAEEVVAEHCANEEELPYSIRISVPPLGAVYFTLKEQLVAPSEEEDEDEEIEEELEENIAEGENETSEEETNEDSYEEDSDEDILREARAMAEAEGLFDENLEELVERALAREEERIANEETKRENEKKAADKVKEDIKPETDDKDIPVKVPVKKSGKK